MAWMLTSMRVQPRLAGRLLSVQECCAVWNLLKRNKFGVGENEINTTHFFSVFKQHTSMRTDTSHHIQLGYLYYQYGAYALLAASTVLLSPKFWFALFILLIKKKPFHLFRRANSILVKHSRNTHWSYEHFVSYRQCLGILFRCRWFSIEITCVQRNCIYIYVFAFTTTLIQHLHRHTHCFSTSFRGA